ncbi:helix-turn-helix transcriptional regulator [Chitinophaga sp. RAB17]|uniref:helix-turn-helix transcriptional regulator n=1 Tax=Chitinophaga sp. RAB17 TaxID=3233049 RepID=UPI003F91404C
MSALLSKEQLENFALQGLSYADDHVSDPFNIKDVSERLGISYSYFYHNFTEYMGEPFWHYVKRHRLELAAGLLRHSGYNISEISDHCGYATTAAFSKAFKQHFKESPKDFRRIIILPNERRTLQITEGITAAFGSEAFGGLFSYERCEKIKLPDSILYYSLISRGQDPVAEMIARMTQHYTLFKKMQTLYDLPQSRIITGTLDAVPVTDYEKLSMFAGIHIPLSATAAHQQLQQNFSYLMTKRITGGNYLKLPVPMDFATAGVPMYNFISMNCKEGIFKMSGNHFFISLNGPSYSEIFIPLLKKHY